MSLWQWLNSFTSWWRLINIFPVYVFESVKFPNNVVETGTFGQKCTRVAFSNHVQFTDNSCTYHVHIRCTIYRQFMYILCTYTQYNLQTIHVHIMYIYSVQFTVNTCTYHVHIFCTIYRQYMYISCTYTLYNL